MHRSIIITLVDVADFIEARPFFIILAMCEGDHRSDEIAAGEIRSVEAFDALREAGEPEFVLQIKEEFFSQGVVLFFLKRRFGILHSDRDDFFLFSFERMVDRRA